MTVDEVLIENRLLKKMRVEGRTNRSVRNSSSTSGSYRRRVAKGPGPLSHSGQ